MKTIGVLQDNKGAIWKEGDIVEITLNGVFYGTHTVRIKGIGVDMMSIEIDCLNEKLIDIHTIQEIKPLNSILVEKNMAKERIAKELLSKHPHIMESYLKWLRGFDIEDIDDVQDIDNVVEYIRKDGFDVKGFRLEEKPHPSVLSFSKDDSYFFDIYLDDYNGKGKKITAGFVNKKSNSQDAKNIEEAISRFCKN